MATIVKACTCASKFQDKRYGKKMRLHNFTAKSNGTVVRCTVCEKEK